MLHFHLPILDILKRIIASLLIETHQARAPGLFIDLHTTGFAKKGLLGLLIGLRWLGKGRWFRGFRLRGRLLFKAIIFLVLVVLFVVVILVVIILVVIIRRLRARLLNLGLPWAAKLRARFVRNLAKAFRRHVIADVFLRLCVELNPAKCPSFLRCNGALAIR